jgi:hypothetical protein
LKKAKKIDVAQIDLNELKDKSAENPGTLAFPHTLGAALVKPEDQGKMKGRAIKAMQQQSERQLKQLYDQMQVLAKQAGDIKNRVHLSERIYLAQINFEPVIGQTYFLYQKHDESSVLSMVAPEEWGKGNPYEKCLAKVKLLADHTWDVLP